MNINWTRVTWYSQTFAIVLFIGVFALGIWLGIQIEAKSVQAAIPPSTIAGSSQHDKDIATVTYACDAGKGIQATYKESSVVLSLSDGREKTLPKVVSDEGSRYAAPNGQFEFWTHGNTAFITESTSTTFANCKQVAAPVSP